jgi:hypothetical protein
VTEGSRFTQWVVVHVSVSALLIMLVFPVPGIATTASGQQLRYCRGFPWNGYSVGVNAKRVPCRTARRVAHLKLNGQGAPGFRCHRGTNQGAVPTYTCKKRGGKRVYIYNAGYEPE